MFKKSKFKWEFAESLPDFWFLIAKNIINLDIIHIFSTENICIPEAVKNIFSQSNKKNHEANLNIYHTGRTLSNLADKIKSVLASKQLWYYTSNSETKQLEPKESNMEPTEFTHKHEEEFKSEGNFCYLCTI